MGVNRLWDILLTIAVQKKIEDLSGLVLAIDASLWIVKVNSIFENGDEGLRCIFNKIIWMKKNNIKMIFVFDGESPALKRKTLEQRRNKRRQLNQLDISKKVEIQIVKAVTGTQSSKAQAKSSIEQKNVQIENMLNSLLKYEQTTNTVDILQKANLQAQVLNKKYELYCESLPNLAKKYGAIEDFSNLDIETKQEILDKINEEDLPTGRDVRSLGKNMTAEEKLFYEMQLIKKKSKIRQLQDQLYRKVMTKKIQNGYEIIQGVYNGKKFIQKRKVKDRSFDEWGFNNSKKNTCNNFKEIFLNNKAGQDESNNSNSNSQQRQQNQYFSSLFNKDFAKDQKSHENIFADVSQRLSQAHQRKRKAQERARNRPKKSLPPKKQSKPKPKVNDSQDQYSYENAFGDVQPKTQKTQKVSQISSQQVPSENPDNFPDYIAVQSLNEMNTSSNNMQLQNILDILGINYMIAPFQAQAQCAALQMLGIVDGVVTEDSDVFLFGARKVYRGVFQDNIKLYGMNVIEQKLKLNREKMVLFALMLGSDYTDGIKGIGIVNAMQILKVHHDIDSLARFTSWAKSADIIHENDENKTSYMLQNATCEEQKQFYLLHQKFKNYWYIHPSFPQQNIYDAYMEPQVQYGDQLQKKLKQKKQVHEQALQRLMDQKFRFHSLQIDTTKKIVMKKFQRKTQAEITDYATSNLAKIQSKRLQKAVDYGESFQ